MLDDGSVSRGRPVVLLVEDHQAMRYATEHALLALGYDVRAFRDGREALGALDQPDHRIAVMVTDIRLPGQMTNGFGLAKLARRRCPGLRIVYMTGHIAANAQQAHALGPILRKPFDQQHLGAALSESGAAAAD